MTSQSNAQRSITITYDISIPADTSVPSTLDAKRSISIPVPNGDLTSLSTALDNARSETNTTLTQWKDEIGEVEKIKEARVAKEAEDRRKAKKAAAQAEDDEDESDADEDDAE